MIKALIIDDEMHCLKTLSMLLKEYCPDVQVVKLCENAEDGIEAIKKFKPDLVFLDIEMPHMNGFEMLEKFSEISFALIFTTGYDQYAIKAFRFSALDYLLKPIDHDELKKANRIVPLVFHRDGGRIKSLRGAWKAACKSAGVPGRIMDDFRRTAVRNLERDGVSRSAAMAMVGLRPLQFNKAEYIFPVMEKHLLRWRGTKTTIL